MEYASVVWDPSLKKNIEQIEKVQRKAARFIVKDYYSRYDGFMTNTLQSLELDTLQERRTKNRLTMCYKITNDYLPSMPKENFFVPINNRRRIKPKIDTDFISDNIVERQVLNNNKCYKVTHSNCELFRNSFFIRSVVDWNRLPNKIVFSQNINSFKNSLKKITLDHNGLVTIV